MFKALSFTTLLLFCSVSVNAQLNGNYTVGGTTPDYGSLGEACDSIVSQGIDGPVVISVRDGVYYDSIYLTTYQGASATNTLTFRSESLDAANVEIINDNNDVVKFNGDSIDFVTVEHLSITVNANQNVFDIRNGPNDITIVDCILTGINTTNTGTGRAVIYSTDNGTYGVNNLRIQNNTIKQGSYGVYVNWNTNSLNNLYVNDNNISDFYYRGISTQKTSKAYVSNNYLQSNNTTSSTDGIHIDDSFDTTIVQNNQIYMTSFSSSSDGLDMAYISGYALVSNNFISVHGAFADGIVLDYISSPMKFYNNTVVSYDDVFDGYNDITMEVVNNILISYGPSGTIFYVSYNNVTVIPETYNNAYYTNGDFAYADWPYNQTYTTFNEWNTLTGNGTGSFEIYDPMFVNDTFDLHVCNDSLIGSGFPLAEVMYDVDGEMRDLMIPSIGADYRLLTGSSFLGDDLGICVGNNSAILGPLSGNDFLWSNGDTTASTTVSTIATYHVTTTNICGTAQDTIEIFDITPVASFTTSQSYFTFNFTNGSVNATDYLWDFGDGNTSTDTNPLHVYAAEGTYTVTLTVTNECGTDSFTQDVSPSYVGLNEVANEELKMYPNPTSSDVTIVLPSSMTQNVHVTLLDLNGREIASKTTNSSEVTFNLSNQPSGVYLIQVAGDEGILNKRLIKQ